eukprot:TRINITY_DN5330_c0_g1_i1.p1 TRINITY_DN5330_c0_g1~~TRINITY_DN5330_c0_g1_i1.p1  ORF type:complete len:1631 (+),score=377.40 TRINITY_DN5330_c0_g1_i1:70-4893(+)
MPPQSGGAALQPRLLVPAKVFFALAAALSVASACVGGWYMYVDGQRVIEETVEEVSATETAAVAQRLEQSFAEVNVSSSEYAFLINDWKYSSLQELQYRLSRQMLSRLPYVPALYGIGVTAVPMVNPITNGSIMIQDVWWDPLTDPEYIERNNGSDRQYASGTSLPADYNSTRCDYEEDQMGRYCVNAYLIEPGTLRQRGLLYSWRSTHVANFGGGGPWQEQQEGWAEHGATFWRPVSIWNSADGTPYVYGSFVRVLPRTGLSKPVLLGYKMLVMAYVSFYPWQGELSNARSRLEGFAAAVVCFLNEGLDSQVLATSEPDALVPRGCASRESVLILKKNPCLRQLSEMSPTIQDVATILSAVDEGAFQRADIRGGEHWMRRRVVFRKQPLDLMDNIHLLWLRPISSVQDKTDRGLFMFIAFLSGMLALQVIALAVQMFKIGAPLSTVGGAMQLVDSLDLDGAEARIRQAASSCVGVTEIQRVVVSFRTALRALRQYRSYLPQAVLAAAAAALNDNNNAQVNSAPSRFFSGAALVQVDEGALVLPQLASADMRNALCCAVSQATTADAAAAMKALLTKRTRACAAAGDTRSARRILDCGWDCDALRAELKLPSPASAERPRAAQQRKTPGDSTCSAAAPLSSLMGGSTVESGSTTSDRGIQRRQASRFMESADDEPASTVATVPLFPVLYQPPSVRKAATSLSVWHGPKGDCYFPGPAVDGMMHDFAVCNSGERHRGAVAIFVYTIELHDPVVWVAWQADQWDLCGNHDSAAARCDFKAVRAEAGERAAVANGAPDTSEAELMHADSCGMRVFGSEGVPRLLRFENAHCGDSELSPLSDSILWAPCPDALVSEDGAFSLARRDGRAVPPGVLEFIKSRDFSTTITRNTWESSAVVTATKQLKQLRATCMARKNQQCVVGKLCQAAREAFRPAAESVVGHGADPQMLADAIYAAYLAKCPGSPSPAQIAAASELTLLRWHDEWLLLAFTGPNNVGVTLGDEPRAELLHRVDNALEEQPYYLINAAIRAQQHGRRDAELRAASAQPPAKLTARQPDSATAEPGPAQFEGAYQGAEVSMMWEGDRWHVQKGGDVAGSLAHYYWELRLQGWGLPQCRALIWWLDDTLRGLPVASGPEDAGQLRRKGYRGLTGVTLDLGVYSRGRVVVFGAFTSTSDDQGVASGFAVGDDSAAIFTMFGQTGRNISPFSRFGREKEILYPPNTLQLVTETLSAEHAAILNKSKLQVFDLRELSPAEAVSYLAKEGALEVCGEHPGVLKQAERAAARAEGGDWVAAVRELLAEPETGVAGRQLSLPVVPRDSVGVVALMFSSGAGFEIGAEIETSVWNSMFEDVERVAEVHGAQLIATYTGIIILRVTGSSDHRAARAALALASELVGAERPSAPQSGHAGHAKTSHAGQISFSPVLAQGPASRAGQRVVAHRAPAALRAHCGVSVGRVHCGFAGSAKHRVEIADGAAVRRARRMAGYAFRFGVTEVVTDAPSASAAASVGLISWTVDIVAFDTYGEVREPILCTAPLRLTGGGMTQEAAEKLQDAWAAVLAVGEDHERRDDAEVRSLRELAAEALQAHPHRASRALAEAAADPTGYCCDWCEI